MANSMCSLYVYITYEARMLSGFVEFCGINQWFLSKIFVQIQFLYARLKNGRIMTLQLKVGQTQSYGLIKSR